MDWKSSQKSQSEEHQKLIEISYKYFNGKPVIIRGNANIKGQYFPDVIKKDTDIECEIVPKSYIKKKIEKWNKKRKKILVIGYSKICLDNFNEIYALDKNNNLIKLF